jgi:hypothetical protein
MPVLASRVMTTSVRVTLTTSAPSFVPPFRTKVTCPPPDDVLNETDGTDETAPAGEQTRPRTITARSRRIIGVPPPTDFAQSGRRRQVVMDAASQRPGVVHHRPPTAGRGGTAMKAIRAAFLAPTSAVQLSSTADTSAAVAVTAIGAVAAARAVRETANTEGAAADTAIGAGGAARAVRETADVGRTRATGAGAAWDTRKTSLACMKYS